MSFGDYVDDHPAKAFVIVVGGILVGVFLICTLIINPLGHRGAQVNCIRYGEATGRTVKFVRYTYWSSDCLTISPNEPDKWISTSQLRGGAE